ncbi:hypothetical protein TNCV_2130961 [Trichonephila clavipes]|nr:hypothetical protein TNCV_2130961 [Trichonephila clavipes]
MVGFSIDMDDDNPLMQLCHSCRLTYSSKFPVFQRILSGITFPHLTYSDPESRVRRDPTQRLWAQLAHTLRHSWLECSTDEAPDRTVLPYQCLTHTQQRSEA